MDAQIEKRVLEIRRNAEHRQLDLDRDPLRQIASWR